MIDVQRRAAATAGLLVIAGVLAGLLSVVSVLERRDYLALLPAHESQVIVGAVAQLAMIPAYAGFALCLYPALRAAGAALSLGFVGLRLVAAAFHLVGAILLPLFLVLGREYAQGGPAGVETLGELLRTARDLVNHVAVIVPLGLGDLLLFTLLYRSRLVPRWLSVWGIAGAGSAMAASLLVLAGAVDVVTPLYLGMTAPLALQSLALAVRLITRGLAR